MFACRWDLQFRERNSELFLELGIKAAHCSLSRVLSFASQTACKYDGKLCTMVGGLIFAVSNPHDTVRCTSMCYWIMWKNYADGACFFVRALRSKLVRRKTEIRPSRLQR